MRTIQLSATEFETAAEALQWANASGQGSAITVAGRYLVAEQAELDRLAAAGVEFAYLCDHQRPDGTQRILTVPVN